MSTVQSLYAGVVCIKIIEIHIRVSWSKGKIAYLLDKVLVLQRNMNSIHFAHFTTIVDDAYSQLSKNRYFQFSKPFQSLISILTDIPCTRFDSDISVTRRTRSDDHDDHTIYLVITVI